MSSYIVKGKNGAVIRAEPALESKHVAELPNGTAVLVVETAELPNGTARVRITSPCEGWCSLKVLAARPAAGGAAPPSGPRGADAAGAGAPPRPWRVLCLHGGGSNATVMKLQCASLQRGLGERAAPFEFVEGPTVATHVDPKLLELFGADAPYWAWYDVTSDGDPDAPLLDRLADPRVQFAYDGLAAALRRVEGVVARDGPFDALVGFSQGCVVATMLTAHREARARALRAAGRARELAALAPMWRLNVLVCGLPARAADCEDVLRALAPLEQPAVLVFGQQDEFYEYGQRLREQYAAPVVIEHPGGHHPPKDAAVVRQICDAIAAQLSR